MPEGPEVETLRTRLDAYIPKLSKLATFEIFSRDFNNNARGFVCQFSQEDCNKIINAHIVAFQRVSKFLIFKFDNQQNLLIHLSFTGGFSKTNPIYPAFKLSFTHGVEDYPLFFSDKRGLAKIWILSDSQLSQKSSLKVGIDALRMEEGSFIKEGLNLLSRKGCQRSQIKPLLMNYSYFAGVGNIYANEVCYAAGINPEEKISNLTQLQKVSILAFLHLILNKALSCGGSTVEDFLALGEPGTYQQHLKIYKADICNRCLTKPLKIKQAGRGTYLCPNCQPLNVQRGESKHDENERLFGEAAHFPRS